MDSPVEIAVPFRLSPGGGIEVVRDPNSQIDQHVRSLIATMPGERVMLPGYGTPTLGLLFEPIDEVAAELSTDITMALHTWEPGITVQDVTPVADDEQLGISKVDVRYQRVGPGQGPIQRTTNTATLKVGGGVSEAVVG